MQEIQISMREIQNGAYLSTQYTTTLTINRFTLLKVLDRVIQIRYTGENYFQTTLKLFLDN